VFTQQRVPQRPKQNKNIRVSQRDGTTSAASSLPLCFAQERWRLKTLGFVKIKGIDKKGKNYFVLICNNKKVRSLKFKTLKRNTLCWWIATQTSFARNDIKDHRFTSYNDKNMSKFKNKP
jgi:hypothetical protein